MTMRKLVRFAAMASLLAGCGGGGGGKPLTETDFCNQKAEAECQVSDRCVVDKDACKAERMTVCAAFVADSKASGTRFFEANNVGTCVSKTTTVYAKTAPITPTDINDMNDACNYVFQGKAKLTEACTVKWDCADKNHICDKSLCAPKVTKNLGDLCGNPGEICNTGSFCMSNGTTSSCVARVASGMTCNVTTTPPCLESLRCAAGTCADRVGTGATCTSNDDCATTAPFCDPYAGNKCDPGLSFAAGSPSCADYGGASSTGTGGTGGGTGGAGGSTGTGGGAGGTTGTGGAGGSGGGTGGTSSGGSGGGGGA